MVTEPQILSSFSPRACPRCMLTCFSAGDRETSTNQLLFMQNKPNFQKAKMNVNSLITTDYENKSNWTLSENKPNTNPIKANTKPIQSQSKPIKCQNKPNTNPIQTQTKPISNGPLTPQEIAFSIVCELVK